MISVRVPVLKALAFVAFCSASATAQQVQLPPELSDAIAPALQIELAAARDAKLPAQLLVLKALEGRSKGASDAHILAAVRALRERLRIAGAVFGTQRSDDLLEAGAAALYAGVNERTLRDIARATPPASVGMALVVLGDLVRRGVPVRSAEEAILSLGNAGADARVFSDFRRSVDDDIRTGLAPQRAAEVRLRGILAKVSGRGDGS